MTEPYAVRDATHQRSEAVPRVTPDPPVAAVEATTGGFGVEFNIGQALDRTTVRASWP